MKIGIITEEQKDLLIGKKYNNDIYYHPILDYNGNWVISEEEISLSDIDWVKNLILTDYEPQIVLSISGTT